MTIVKQISLFDIHELYLMERKKEPMPLKKRGRKSNEKQVEIEAYQKSSFE